MPFLLRYFLPFFLLPALPVAAQPPLVAVDVGHTLREPGATSARGRSEFSFNRELAEPVQAALADRGLRVVPVNFDGQIASLDARPRAARGANFLLSIHHDSIQEAYLERWDWDGSEQTFTEAKRGFGIFVSARNPDYARSLLCASAMGAALRRAGFVPTPFHAIKHVAADRQNGVWIYNNLVVLHKSTFPAVLFEAGVIKHREEELELTDGERQQRMADALAIGIAACLSVREIPVRE